MSENINKIIGLFQVYIYSCDTQIENNQNKIKELSEQIEKDNKTNISSNMEILSKQIEINSAGIDNLVAQIDELPKFCEISDINPNSATMYAFTPCGLNEGIRTYKTMIYNLRSKINLCKEQLHKIELAEKIIAELKDEINNIEANRKKAIGIIFNNGEHISVYISKLSPEHFNITYSGIQNIISTPNIKL